MTECPTDDGGGGYSGYAMWTAFGVGGFCSVVLAVVLIRFRANIRLYMLRREQSYAARPRSAKTRNHCHE